MLEKRIERKALAGLLLALIGKRTRSLAIDPVGLTAQGGGRRSVPFIEITGPAVIEKTWVFTSVKVPIGSGAPLRLIGAKPEDARDFIEAFNASWQTAIETLIGTQAVRISALTEALPRLLEPRRYPSACLIQPFVSEARALMAAFPQGLPGALWSEGRLTQSLAEKLAPYVELRPIPLNQVFDRLNELGQILRALHRTTTDGRPPY